ncbi:MAG: HD domain-containing protein [Candidatus Babeliales bacterium]
MVTNNSFTSLIAPVIPIINDINAHSGIAYLVGGAVRDIVLKRIIKDGDIEVHGLTLESLEAILKKYGPVSLVGKQFGVLRLHGTNIDWSLPRRDSKGRKPTIEVDPAMTIEQACRRRDITINAMALNLNPIAANWENKAHASNFDIIDPYGGLDAIAHQELRAVDQELFLQDPLRFFRVMHFIGRFEMMPDAALNKLCATIELADLVTGKPLAQERIFEEIKKLFLLSRSPSRGVRWLASINRLQEIFPELHALIGIKQRPDYHPEGDVFEHTMQALDAAARFSYYQDSATTSANEEKLSIMLAVLCHDLGKATHTDEHLCCKGHEAAGIDPAKKLLSRLTNNTSIEKMVITLITHHTAPYIFVQGNAGAKAYKRLAIKLSPYTSLRQLGLVALADLQGRRAQGPEPLTFHTDFFEDFIRRATKSFVVDHAEPPVLLGRHLADAVEPGPKMGALLKKAYDLQIEEGISDWQELKRRVLKQ